MQTDHIFPPSRLVPQAADLLRLVQNALVRACMDTRFKRLVGWRGFAVCPEPIGAATLRLTGRPGIYGIVPDGCDADGEIGFARFGLHYFPLAGEPLFESLSPAAAVLIAAPEFRARVRNFPAHPELIGPFAIGVLTVGFGRHKDVLSLTLETCEHHRVVSVAGLRAADGAVVVPPGGAEQDVPARALAENLLDVLACAVTACVGEPPRLLHADSAPADEIVREADGGWHARGCDDNRRLLRTIAWGEVGTLDLDHLRLDGATTTETWTAATGAPPPATVAAALWWRTHALDALLAEGAHPEAADRRPSLIVLCGFLGSGKTTLVNQIIEHHRNHDQFVAVIQNEIGAESVDAHLVEESDSVESLDEGCICCTLAGSLAKGAQRLIDRYHPERIVLETTGLANPMNLVDELATLSDLVRLDVMVTVVDADNVLAALATSAVAREQIRGGDVLVLNKCDLVDAAALAAVRGHLRALNDRAPILETCFARIHPALLLGDVDDLPDAAPVADPAADVAAHVAAALGCCGGAHHAGAADHPHEHHHHHEHDHHDHTAREHHPGSHRDGGDGEGAAGHARHDHRADGFVAIRLPQPPGLSRDALFERLEGSPGRAFRIKGIVDLVDGPGPEALQCVGARRELAPLPSVYEGAPFLIFIGQDLDRAALTAHWLPAVAPARDERVPVRA